MPTKKTKPAGKQVKRGNKRNLEKKYREIFQEDRQQPSLENRFLVQPLPSKTYRTVTTYGAYEDPI